MVQEIITYIILAAVICAVVYRAVKLIAGLRKKTDDTGNACGGCGCCSSSCDKDKFRSLEGNTTC